MEHGARGPRSRPAFPKPESDGFYQRLRILARQIDTEQGRRARALTWLQVIALPGSLVTTYALLLLKGERIAWFYACYGLFGILVPFAVLAVAHPAVHNSLFRSGWANRMAAHLLDLLGTNSFIWGKRHVQLHHTYTNIPGWDVDIEDRTVIRLAPTDPLRWGHRYQHLYLPLLYPLYTINWLLLRDFRDAFSKSSLVGRTVRVPGRERVKLFVFKAIYLTYIVVVPAALLSHGWHAYVLGFLLMHGFSGVLTLLIVLPTHFDEHAAFPVPDDQATMQEEWARHQIHTTNDYSTNRSVFTFLLGSLNHHVAHHLFPTVHHNALPALTSVVASVAGEENLPYKSFTWVAALRSHFRLLKRNGMSIADIFEE
jgi:linoleoyl-CoA desaturase